MLLVASFFFSSFCFIQLCLSPLSVQLLLLLHIVCFHFISVSPPRCLVGSHALFLCRYTFYLFLTIATSLLLHLHCYIFATSLFLCFLSLSLSPQAETWCDIGGTKKFLNDLFQENIFISTPKISDDLFQSSIVFFMFLASLYFLFFTKNLYFRIKYSLMTHFFTQFVLSHASDNTTSRNIGRTDACASPISYFLGGTVPPVLLSLRPCLSLSLSLSVYLSACTRSASL